MIGMTGFGEMETDLSGWRVAVRIHGVNSRQLDTVFRLPEELRRLEPALRERLGRAVRRGRCEVSVGVKQLGESRSDGVRIRPEAVRALVESARPLVESQTIRGEISLGDLLRIPALLEFEQPVSANDRAESLPSDGILRAFTEALDAFVAARRVEGERTQTAIVAIWRELVRSSEEIRAAVPGAQERLAAGFRDRLTALAVDLAGDRERWIQETAVLAEKADMREEVDRFDAHLAALGDLVESPEPVGRRLDFLAQEMLRELNTMSSKCRDVALVEMAMEARLACEQIREQAQNVE